LKRRKGDFPGKVRVINPLAAALALERPISPAS